MVLEILLQVVVSVLLIAGSLLALLAAVGLHRFPDVFCRMHAASKPATLGVLLVALATGLTLTTQGALIKLLLVVVLQFLTTPVGSHMVGRAAYRSGSPLTERTAIDEFGRPSEIETYGTSR